MTNEEAMNLLSQISDCFDHYGPLPDAISKFREAILASDWLKARDQRVRELARAAAIRGEVK